MLGNGDEQTEEAVAGWDRSWWCWSLASAPISQPPSLRNNSSPRLRAQAIQYLRDRFHSEVELAELHINRPKMSTVQILLRHGRGAIVAWKGTGFPCGSEAIAAGRRCSASRRFSSPWIWGYCLNRRSPSISSRWKEWKLTFRPRANGRTWVTAAENPIPTSLSRMSRSKTRR